MENKNQKQTPLNAGKPGSKMPKFSITWVYFIIIAFLIGSYFFNDTPAKKEVAYSVFEEYMHQSVIEKRSEEHTF